MGSYLTLLWILCGMSLQGIMGDISQCNQTYSGLDLASVDTVYRIIHIPNSYSGKKFLCTYTFKGIRTQLVQIIAKDVRTGYFDMETQRCEEGHLRICGGSKCNTDKNSLPPLDLCGHTERTKRTSVKVVTAGKDATVEFLVAPAQGGKGHEFEVRFLRRDVLLGNKKEKLFGNLAQKAGLIDGTVCDWLVSVDQCRNDFADYCDIVSPGYPGVYPPQTRCKYTIKNFDGERVEVKLGGKYHGKFDLRDSSECEDDYVELYDGPSETDPKIGRYCGTANIHAISSQPTMLLIFRSGMAQSPWSYHGFSGLAGTRNILGDGDGALTNTSVCNWTFRSRNLRRTSKEGLMHTPDHMIPKLTTCSYDFIGEKYETVEVELKFTSLRPDCMEYVEVFENGTLKKKICQETVDKFSNRGSYHYIYNSTSPHVTVKYTNKEGHVSNPTDVVYIDFLFQTNPALVPDWVKEKEHYDINTDKKYSVEEVSDDQDEIDLKSETVQPDVMRQSQSGSAWRQPHTAILLLAVAYVHLQCNGVQH